jgi:hypothetical protein
MQPYQERVVIEKTELDEKLVKLKEFFKSNIYKELDVYEMDRLQRQAEFMKSYSDILGERIAAFEQISAFED